MVRGWVDMKVDAMGVKMVVTMAEMMVDCLEPCSAANLVYKTVA